MDSPRSFVVPRFVHTWSRWSTMEELSLMGYATLASGAFPAANEARFYPIRLPWPYPLKRFFVANGGTVSGNIDVGIYTPNGGKIFTKGSTAQAGVNVFQYLSVSPDIILDPGTYYLAIACSSATATFMRSQAGSIEYVKQAGELRQATAFALPASLTPVVITAPYRPLFGITSTESGF